MRTDSVNLGLLYTVTYHRPRWLSWLLRGHGRLFGWKPPKNRLAFLVLYWLARLSGARVEVKVRGER